MLRPVTNRRILTASFCLQFSPVHGRLSITVHQRVIGAVFFRLRFICSKHDYDMALNMTHAIQLDYSVLPKCSELAEK